MDQERVDRDRLKEVHRSEQTESKVNEDFVEWLRTSGPTWLLAGLVALTAYLLLVQWRQRAEREQTQAWVAFAEAQASDLPSAYESVAEQYAEVGRMGVLGRLRAAQRLMNAVQADVPIDAADDVASDTPPALTEEEREHYLTRADALYQRIIELDDGSFGMALHTINALYGRAAVAEARTETDRAREFYEQAAERAEASFPTLATQARSRIETIDQYANVITLAEEDDSVNAADEDLQHVIVEPALRELIFPNGDDLLGSSANNQPLPGSPGFPGGQSLPPDLQRLPGAPARRP